MERNLGNIILTILGSDIPKVRAGIINIIRDKYNEDIKSDSDEFIIFCNKDMTSVNTLFPKNDDNKVVLRITDKEMFEVLFNTMIENGVIENTNAVIKIQYTFYDVDYISSQIKKFNGAFSEDAVSTCDIRFGENDTIFQMEINILFRK